MVSAIAARIWGSGGHQGVFGLQQNPTMRSHQIVKLQQRSYPRRLPCSRHALLFNAHQRLQIFPASRLVAQAKLPQLNQASSVRLDEQAEEEYVELEEGALHVPVQSQRVGKTDVAELHRGRKSAVPLRERIEVLARMRGLRLFHCVLQVERYVGG